MICSVLLPSRGRPCGLLDAVESLHVSADNNDFDILIRLDYDDVDSHRIARYLRTYSNVRLFYGPRGNGYLDLHVMYDDLISQTQSPWLFVMNDDAIVLSEGSWTERLKALPMTGVIVQPEHMWYGFSHYICAEGGAFPIMPNGCWRQFGLHMIDDPIDYRIDELLRGKGWKTHFLEGLTVRHNRDDDETLNRHRAL